jgi:dienelactone hydrolase
MALNDRLPRDRRSRWSSHRAVGRWLGVVAVVVAVAGCGSGGSGNRPCRTTATTNRAAPSTVPEVVEIYAGAGRGWRSLGVRARGTRLSAAVLGAGDVGVVLANQSVNNPCDWMSLARELGGKGMRALVFEYDAEDRADREVLAAARALRAAGARQVATIGASLGGRAVIQAATRDHGTLAAAVSLSAERSVGSLPEILPLARRVQMSSLYIGSRQDGSTTFGRDTRQFHRVTPAKVNQILLVAGGDHCVELLSDANGPRVRAAIIDFLARVRPRAPAPPWEESG